MYSKGSNDALRISLRIEQWNWFESVERKWRMFGSVQFEWHEKVKTIKQMDERSGDSDRAYRQTAAVIWAGEKKTPFSLELLHLNQRHRKEKMCWSYRAANTCAYIRNNQIYMRQRWTFCCTFLSVAPLAYISWPSIQFWVSLFHRHQFHPFEILICTLVATFIYADPSKVAIAIALLNSTHWICAIEKQAMPCYVVFGCYFSNDNDAHLHCDGKPSRRTKNTQ